MPAKTALERIIDLEYEVLMLKQKIDQLLGTVVLVEKRKPGPAEASVKPKKRKIKVKPGFKRPKAIIEGGALPRGVVIDG